MANNLVYDVHQKPPFGKNLVYAFQQVLAILAATVLVPVLVNGNSGTNYLSQSAALIGADAVLLAKNVDGVYSADPKKDPNAVRFDSLTYEEVLEKRLAVMDSTATCIAMDNRIPIKVFALREPENILRAARGEAVGTLVH